MLYCVIEYVHGGPKPNGSQQKKEERKKTIIPEIENRKSA